MRLLGTTTLGSVGTKTINFGFRPTWARFKVCSKTSSQSYEHLSLGEVVAIPTGFAQFVTSTFHDTTGGQSVNNNSKVVSHYERASGNITEVLAASFVGFTANGLQVNVTTGNSAYQVVITAGD